MQWTHLHDMTLWRPWCFPLIYCMSNCSVLQSCWHCLKGSGKRRNESRLCANSVPTLYRRVLANASHQSRPWSFISHQLFKIFGICAPDHLFRWFGLCDYSDTLVCHIWQETLIPFHNSRHFHLYTSYMYHNHYVAKLYQCVCIRIREFIKHRIE